MQRDRFPPEVARQLKWYVYRLIDPRNGETFYVGKGQGDRVFQHAKGALEATPDEDNVDLKSSRLKAIRAAGLDVGHLIHRHNIEDEDVAFQIEAALIEAYPGLTNKVDGHGTGDYGCRHVEQIIMEYSAETFEIREPLILVSISKSYQEEGVSAYDAARAAWRINKRNAETFGLVLAHCQGIVVGAFRPKKWLSATRDNFSWLAKDFEDRFGFEGDPAEPEVEKLYIGKRVPDKFRRKGAANPVRFVSEITSTPPEPNRGSLAEAIRRSFAVLGGVDLEIPPRGPMREPPDFRSSDYDPDPAASGPAPPASNR